MQRNSSKGCSLTGVRFDRMKLECKKGCPVCMALRLFVCFQIAYILILALALSHSPFGYWKWSFLP